MKLLDQPIDLIGIATIARAVREGRLSAVALIESRLARIERLHPRLNAFREILADLARPEAAPVAAIVAAGRDPGPPARSDEPRVGQACVLTFRSRLSASP